MPMHKPQNYERQIIRIKRRWSDVLHLRKELFSPNNLIPEWLAIEYFYVIIILSFQYKQIFEIFVNILIYCSFRISLNSFGHGHGINVLNVQLSSKLKLLHVRYSYYDTFGQDYANVEAAYLLAACLTLENQGVHASSTMLYCTEGLP